MKVEVPPAGKEFKPITLTITFESRDELLDMYARHALKNYAMAEHIDTYTGEVVRIIGKMTLVNAINKSPKTISGHPLLLALKEEILR